MKKILIALLVLGQLVFADSVSNWCGYNGELAQKLNDDAYFKKHVGYDKKGAPVIAVSTFDSTTLEKIKKIYEIYNYDYEKIITDISNTVDNNKKGMWYDIFNKLTLLKLSKKELVLLLGSQLACPDISDGISILPEGGLYKVLDDKDKIKMILFLNPKIILANQTVIKNGWLTEKHVIKEIYRGIKTTFNPCK